MKVQALAAVDDDTEGLNGLLHLRFFVLSWGDRLAGVLPLTHLTWFICSAFLLMATSLVCVLQVVQMHHQD